MVIQKTAAVVMLGLALAACERRGAPEAGATAVLSASAREASVPAKHVRAVGQLGPGKGTLVVSLEAPADGKLTAGAPLSVEARGEHLIFPARVSERLDPARLPLRIPIEVADGAVAPVHVKVSYYWCGLGEASACRPERVELVVELDTSGDSAGGEALLSYRAAGS
jgi:hypothetical protein